MDERRQVLRTRAHKLRKKISNIFDSTAYWNFMHPFEEPIDPDPDGLLQQIANALDKQLSDVGRMSKKA